MDRHRFLLELLLVGGEQSAHSESTFIEVRRRGLEVQYSVVNLLILQEKEFY
jgi:hypothetical protein